MQEHQHRGAEHREGTDQQGHARWQRGRRDQDRPEQKKSERIFQPAGEVQQRGKFGDVEGQEPGGAVGLKPLGLAEAHPQRHVQQRRQGNNRKARPNRNFEFQAEMHHQNRCQLAADREPAQPDQCVQPDIARPLMGSGQTKHTANVAIRPRRTKLGYRTSAWPADARDYPQSKLHQE